MKVYRFGQVKTSCHDIIIEEDSGEIRVAFVGLKSVKEYIAQVTEFGSGAKRLLYGNGSSMPYKNSEGKICEKYVLIYEN